MKTTELLKKRASYLKEIEATLWTADLKVWMRENIAYKVGKVYEVVENGIKRRGFKRFVIYSFEHQMMGRFFSVRCGGWWLDDTDTPTKWDCMTIYGAVNSAVLKLSENQTNNPVPKEFANR
jgi:hypothetical protein